MERALVLADELVTKKLYIALLRQAVVENAKAGNYRAALQHFSTLLEVDNNLVAEDPLRNLVERIKQTIDGDSALTTNGEIPQCDDCDLRSPFWRHALVRNRFTINQVDGEVVGVEILCGSHSVSLSYKPEVKWSVDKGWGECDLLVSGNSGTSFQLIELTKANSR